ncbi:hypothetical protein [Adlercreutzia sp. ZJ473]|uniref:hypothetical protein n=1 Tax=Adlercreutzia sp. ZJ473 TaxID=2722822 RepID=UPI00155808DB|nr:hypothetical protein [Adlercreutzia sp. ZJ473]
MRRKCFAVVLTLSLGMGALWGCSSQEPQQEPQEAASSQQAAAPERQVIGKESDAAYKIEVTNGLANDVTSLFVKKTGEESFPAGLMAEGDVFKAEDTVDLFYAPEEEGEETLYDILVGFEDGTTCLFEQIDLANLAEMELKSEGDVAYVTYVGKDGASGSTQQDAIDRKAAAEAAMAQAQAEAEAEAAAAAQAQAEAEAAAAAQPSNTGSSSGGSSNGGSSAPAQTEDRCVDGGVALR